MEEEKAAALYDELTRKGGGAARFKQGLGFSSTPSEALPSRGSALPSFTSSSAFLSQFVQASNPSTAAELDKQAQLSSIQNKLKKKPPKSQNLSLDSDISQSISRSRGPECDRRSSRGNRSPEKNRHSKRKSRSHSRSRSRSRSRDGYRRSRRRSRSRSRSRSRERNRHSRRSRSRERDEYYRGRRRRRSRSESPRPRSLNDSNTGRSGMYKEKNDKVHYAELIEGYEKMTPAEKVRAKMKLQLTETAEKDEKKGMGSGWERFDFDKDAPLDDEQIEAAEDDAALVKHIGQSFRFSTMEARREEEIKAAHDEAMFGASLNPPPTTRTDDEEEEAANIQKQTNESPSCSTSLLSDQVLTMQGVSWRDRVSR